MAVGNEISLEEETRDTGHPHQNITGTKFTTPEGIEKLAMDVKLLDVTDDASSTDQNILDIKLLLGCMLANQEKFNQALITHLQLITNEEKL